jgi:hypothetical protein
MATRSRSCIVIIAGLLLLSFFYFGNYYFKKEDISPALQVKEVSQLSKNKDSINHPNKVRSNLFPSQVRWKNSSWKSKYSYSSINYFLTLLSLEIFEKSTQMASGQYLDEILEAGFYRWSISNDPLVKEASLFVFEMLYKISGKEKYLEILLSESDGFLENISSLDSISDANKLATSPIQFQLLRLISYRYLIGAEPLPDEKKIVDFYLGILSSFDEIKEPISKQCSALWSFAPFFKKSSMAKTQMASRVSDIHASFVNKLTTDIHAFDNVGSVLMCLTAFYDLDGLFEIDGKKTFDLAFDKYIVQTFNKETSDECPLTGSFYSLPVQESSCRHAKVYLSHNVFIQYLLNGYRNITEN